MGAAVPTLVGVGMFTAVQQVDRMLEPVEAFEDFEGVKYRMWKCLISRNSK